MSDIAEKKFTREQVLDFNEDDWSFRRSSGYGGYDNVHSEYYDKESTWIYDRDYMAMKHLKAKYNEEFQQLSEFRGFLDIFIADQKIHDFLNEKYFKQ